MKCFRPIWILNPKIKFNHYFNPELDPRYIRVPCGRCPACELNKRSDWSYRMYLEFMHSDATYFFTLTYSDDKLVRDSKGRPIVFKPHLDQMIKRLNKRLRFRYFISSEYGPTTLRPHYHGLIFLRNVDNDIIDSDGNTLPTPLKKYIASDPLTFLDEVLRPYWSVKTGNYNSDGSPEYSSLGINLQCDYCNGARIHYMSKYLHKKLVPDSPTPVWSMKSPGLGKYISEDSEFLNFLQTGKPLKYNDYVVPVPRYFRQKFCTKDKFTVSKQNAILSEESRVNGILEKQYFDSHPGSSYDDYIRDTLDTPMSYLDDLYIGKLIDKSKQFDL